MLSIFFKIKIIKEFIICLIIKRNKFKLLLIYEIIKDLINFTLERNESDYLND